MFSRDDITDVLIQFTEESGHHDTSWFQEHGVDPFEMARLYNELLTGGEDIMRQIMDERDDLSDKSRQRSEMLIELFEKTSEDIDFRAIVLTLFMMCTGIGMTLKEKQHENEIEWKI